MGQEVIGIDASLQQINVQIDRPHTKEDGTVVGPGRVNMDDVEPGRTAEIVAGKSNLGLNNILVINFEGHKDKISVEENNSTENVTVEVLTAHGHGRETITSYSIGKVGDDKIDKDGDAPFEGIREGVDAHIHYNRAHLRCTTNDGKMQCSVRQKRVTKNGTFVSPWLGPYAVGRQ